MITSTNCFVLAGVFGFLAAVMSHHYHHSDLPTLAYCKPLYSLHEYVPAIYPAVNYICGDF